MVARLRDPSGHGEDYPGHVGLDHCALSENGLVFFRSWTAAMDFFRSYVFGFPAKPQKAVPSKKAQPHLIGGPSFV